MMSEVDNKHVLGTTALFCLYKAKWQSIGCRLVIHDNGRPVTGFYGDIAYRKAIQWYQLNN